MTAELPYPAMITHSLVIGYPDKRTEINFFSGRLTGTRSGQRHQVG